MAETGLVDRDDQRPVPIGFPKTDPLLDGTLDHATCSSPSAGWTAAARLFSMRPTGAAHNSLETMGEEVLRLLGATDRYDILVKPHDHPKNGAIDWFKRHLAPLCGPHLRLVRAIPTSCPCCYLADLLITDASSVANEFALLDRPIVFLDVPRLLEEARAVGANLDLQTWGRRGGVLVTTPAEIVPAVADSLAEPERLSSVRRAIARDLFFNPGNATNAAVAWLREHLDV